MEKFTTPSPAQLALAMAIVKLKPVGIDIKEYLLQIRKNIKRAHRTERYCNKDKFLDSISFWQQAYERSEAEQSKLLDRVYELEQRNESLLARTQGADAIGANRIEVPSKRKATAKSNATGNTATMRKRAKTQLLPRTGSILLSGDSPLGLSGDIIDSLGSLEQSTAPFLRQFYTLQKVLQKRPNNSNIIKAAVELCGTTARKFLSAVGESNRSRPKSKIILPKKPDVLAILHSTDSAYGLLIQALKKLSVTEQTLRDVGHITYQLVRLYEAVLEILRRYCLLKSEQTLLNTNTSAMITRQKQKAKEKGSKTGCFNNIQEDLDDEIATQMSLLLSKMGLSLNMSCINDRGVMEGFLFVLLSRVGKLLCLFVFQDLRLRPDLHMDPSKLSLPEGLKEMDLDENSLHAAAMEAKHLIWPLERILAALETPSLSPSDSSTAPQSTPFIARIKEKLQGTLLQSVFGPDSIWVKVLQNPAQPEDRDLERLRACSQIPEQSVPDWFVQEVWRLLGWELVAMSHPSEA
ncbi:hypothetical protein BO71DRAFT_422284 [Aspergillus ellipticus CBS 707.79]|uniref:Uncharacterized protein n=1 Tax=Aspergillus ellipticus CBS 707.79 TaxID=1448320 RepID=A0A319D7B7_9EURO|nr:hypothetical protein BO71DRAFT_422284 [Aspergillus ellipticus CBS 707.79]